MDAARCEQRRASLHDSPRAFGTPTSLWTLARLAKVGGEQGLTPGVVSIESIRRALQRRRVSWTRAKPGITRPEPRYAAKKSTAIG
ncbi:MAG TPA: hypothetical protein VES89_02375 [Candidatus Competibacteraceae bacterium]|nr:hypothetical protein [Candidatus Competibacteraceae bacterium]